MRLIYYIIGFRWYIITLCYYVIHTCNTNNLIYIFPLVWLINNNYYLQESSHQYWPVEGQVAQFGEFVVDLINQEEWSGFTVRTLDILQNKVVV